MSQKCSGGGISLNMDPGANGTHPQFNFVMVHSSLSMLLCFGISVHFELIYEYFGARWYNFGELRHHLQPVVRSYILNMD